MRVLLRWFEAVATRRPGRVLVALAIVTVGLAALASRVEVEVDLTQLGSEDSAAVAAMDRVRQDFADPTAAVQVILDAGPGNDVLTGRGLEAVAEVERVTTAALGPDLRDGAAGGLLSLRSAVAPALAAQGVDPGAADDAQLAAAVGRALDATPQLAGLVSDDAGDGTARATVVVALLDPALSEPERTEAAERVEDAFEAGAAGAALDGLQVTVFSSGLFVSGLLDAIRGEVPLLFGLALLVVLAILALAYRSVFDVAIGAVGLLATVVWTFGFASLLGPSFLGWTGPLTQLAVIVPVLLVGLGIDYSVHLTARYREQRANGQAPAAAAGRALTTVGAALVLATAATAVGFGSIAAAPVAMLADFGVFVAVGVVCALVVMGLLVPAARVLYDGRAAVTGAAGVRELRLGRLLEPAARLARTRPWLGLAVAAALATASLAAATGLAIEFDRDDFIPDGSDLQATLAHQEELFGGGVTETTYVLVEGDLTDPAVAEAVLAGEHAAGTVEGVRTVAGRPQVMSAVSLAAAALTSPSSDGGLPPEADLGAVYEQLRDEVGAQRIDQVLTADATAAVVQVRTTVGDAGAERLRDELDGAFAPVEAAGADVTVTSEPIIIGEMSEDLSAFQLQAIALTLVVVLVLLVAYEAVVRRRPMLGLIAMIPAAVGASLVLGTMWLLGISFNVLTANLTAIAVGIGVPYGVHVVNRFAEDSEVAGDDPAVVATLRSTGGALTGSALTTLGAFVVLAFSGLPPIRSLGLLGGAGIVFALLAAVLVQPGALVLWARRHGLGGRAREREPSVLRS